MPDVNDSAQMSGFGYPPSYAPPHGGHTKNSLIRQEISNYEALRDQLEKNMPPRDIQEFNNLKDEKMQGRQNLQARLLKYHGKNRDIKPIIMTSINQALQPGPTPSPLFTQRDIMEYNQT